LNVLKTQVIALESEILILAKNTSLASEIIPVVANTSNQYLYVSLAAFGFLSLSVMLYFGGHFFLLELIKEKLIVSSGFFKSYTINDGDVLSCPKILIDGLDSSFTIKNGIGEISCVMPLFSPDGSVLFPLASTSLLCPINLLSLIQKSEKFEIIQKNGHFLFNQSLEMGLASKNLEIQALEAKIQILQAPLIADAVQTINSLFSTF